MCLPRAATQASNPSFSSEGKRRPALPFVPLLHTGIQGGSVDKYTCTHINEMAKLNRLKLKYTQQLKTITLITMEKLVMTR